MSHQADHAAPAHAHDEPHALPMWILIAVFVALLVFTAVTVAVAKVNLGELNLPIAMAVAVVKGALVVLFFMHLRWDSIFNAVAIISGLAFVALFISFAMIDVGEYRSQITPAWKQDVAADISKPVAGDHPAAEHAPAAPEHGAAPAEAPAHK